MDDPYRVLGLEKSASADEIKRAYRTLAKKLHPDLNPNDANIERRFKQVSQAYDILGDKDKRARFDRGEIDAEGTERAPFNAGGFRRGNPFGGGPQGHPGAGAQTFDASDLFSELFENLGGQRGPGPGAGAGRARPRRPAETKVTVTVPFVTAATGGSIEVRSPMGKRVKLRVPAGATSGQVLRLAGQGQAGQFGAPPGDLLVEFDIGRHPVFRREGDDIHIDVPVDLSEAVSGARITVPTVDGHVAVAVPAMLPSGRTLRLRGKGIGHPSGERRGDQYVHLAIMLPETLPDDLAEAIAKLPGRADAMRDKLG